jgi:rhodanese-related sulfurtransferase
MLLKSKKVSFVGQQSFITGEVCMKFTMKCLAGLAALMLIPLAVFAAKYQEIDVNGVKKMMDAGGVLVVNPLTPIEFDDEHIAGSVNIPIEYLKGKLPADKNQPIIFYCLGEKCVYSWRAAEDAADLGYKNVYAFRGGLPAWKAAGYPTASTEKLPDLATRYITTEQLAMKLQKEDIVLVDINAQEDSDKFWVDTPKRVHIPLLELNEQYRRLPKGKEIVLMCLKGQRGPTAARFLAIKGYNNVSCVEGGIQKWVMEGRPIKKK